MRFLWLLFGQTLENSIESIEVVSFKSNSPDWIAASRSFTDVAMSLDALSFVEDGVMQRCEGIGGDSRTKFITHDLLIAVFSCYCVTSDVFIIAGLRLGVASRLHVLRVGK